MRVQELHAFVNQESRRLFGQIHELGERVAAAGEAVANYEEAGELQKIAWALEREARAIVLLGLELGSAAARLGGLAFLTQVSHEEVAE